MPWNKGCNKELIKMVFRDFENGKTRKDLAKKYKRNIQTISKYIRISKDNN